MNGKSLGWIFVTALTAMAALPARAAGKLQVAVTVKDVEAIVQRVGGDDVEAFTLFKGCILRKDMQVEAAVRQRLLKADAVVWTGFFNESAAIHESVRLLDQKGEGRRPLWIDVSRGAARINVPISSCEGYVEVSFMQGDPFFWLNPRNGAVIARNAAEGLALLRPERKEAFFARAEKFAEEMEGHIGRWQQALVPLKDLRIFSAQCGWQNFSQIGGPKFAACKSANGVLPSPASLVDYVKDLKADVVIVDPNTPPEYGRAFREGTSARVLEIPSSLDALPGGRAYPDLFDNLVKALSAARS